MPNNNKWVVDWGNPQSGVIYKNEFDTEVKNMIYALYNDFGEVFCVAHSSENAYIRALEYLRQESKNEGQYTNWLLDLKYNYNKNPKSYGVFGVVWVKGEDKNIVE